MRATKEKEADGQKERESEKVRWWNRRWRRWRRRGRMKCNRCQEDPHLTRVTGCKEWRTIAHNLMFPGVFFSFSHPQKKLWLSSSESLVLWFPSKASLSSTDILNAWSSSCYPVSCLFLLTQETRQTPTQNKVTDVENDCESYSHEKLCDHWVGDHKGRTEVTASEERRDDEKEGSKKEDEKEVIEGCLPCDQIHTKSGSNGSRYECRSLFLYNALFWDRSFFSLHVFMSVWVLVLNEFLVVSLTLSSKVIRILKLELQTDRTEHKRQREGKRKEKIRAKQQGHFGCSSSLMILTDGHDNHLVDASWRWSWKWKGVESKQCKWRFLIFLISLTEVLSIAGTGK